MQKQENRVELNRGQIIDQIISSVNKRKATDNKNYMVHSYNVTLFI